MRTTCSYNRITRLLLGRFPLAVANNRGFCRCNFVAAGMHGQTDAAESWACSIQQQLAIDLGEAVARICILPRRFEPGEMRHADLSLSDDREDRTQQH
jgi:hypothetical protein